MVKINFVVKIKRLENLVIENKKELSLLKD